MFGKRDDKKGKLSFDPPHLLMYFGMVVVIVFLFTLYFSFVGESEQNRIRDFGGISEKGFFERVASGFEGNQADEIIDRNSADIDGDGVIDTNPNLDHFGDEDGDGVSNSEDIDLDGDGVFNAEDCNPSDADIFPGNSEKCDGKDNNCNRQVDEGDVCGSVICNDGETRACGSDVGECSKGLESCVDNGWSGVCSNQVLPFVEICDGKDNDCDGLIDDGSNCGVEQEQTCKEKWICVDDNTLGHRETSCEITNSFRCDFGCFSTALGDGKCRTGITGFSIDIPQIYYSNEMPFRHYQNTVGYYIAAQDTSGGSVSVAVDWGDGKTENVAIPLVNDKPGGLTGLYNIDHTYPDHKIYDVKVTASKGGNTITKHSYLDMRYEGKDCVDYAKFRGQTTSGYDYARWCDPSGGYSECNPGLYCLDDDREVIRLPSCEDEIVNDCTSGCANGCNEREDKFFIDEKTQRFEYYIESGNKFIEHVRVRVFDPVDENIKIMVDWGDGSKDNYTIREGYFDFISHEFSAETYRKSTGKITAVNSRGETDEFVIYLSTNGGVNAYGSTPRYSYAKGDRVQVSYYNPFFGSDSVYSYLKASPTSGGYGNNIDWIWAGQMGTIMLAQPSFCGFTDFLCWFVKFDNDQTGWVSEKKISVPKNISISGKNDVALYSNATWKISSVDPWGGNLKYTVGWGDGKVDYYTGVSSQEVTISHQYSHLYQLLMTVNVEDSKGFPSAPIYNFVRVHNSTDLFSLGGRVKALKGYGSGASVYSVPDNQYATIGVAPTGTPGTIVNREGNPTWNPLWHSAWYVKFDNGLEGWVPHFQLKKA